MTSINLKKINDTLKICKSQSVLNKNPLIQEKIKSLKDMRKEFLTVYRQLRILIREESKSIKSIRDIIFEMLPQIEVNILRSGKSISPRLRHNIPLPRKELIYYINDIIDYLKSLKLDKLQQYIDKLKECQIKANCFTEEEIERHQSLLKKKQELSIAINKIIQEIHQIIEPDKNIIVNYRDNFD